MIFLDKPYVSEFLKETINRNAFPVVKTASAEEILGCNFPNFLDESEAVQAVKADANTPIYTNSENAIGWISKHLPFTRLPQKIELFKNKVKFRELIKSIYPDFYFEEVPLDALDTVSITEMPMPFVIKPTVGFFSMGVYKVSTVNAWAKTKLAIKAEMRRVKNLYPTAVMDTTSFIIEQCIPGDEFAIDAYFDQTGEPVILNIYQHLFSSNEDVSDRVYFSSKSTIEENLVSFTEFLQKIGNLADVKNFPVHVEVRRGADGAITPIEVNPMRFGGWCSTPDMTYFAYGINPYEYYFAQKRPDWAEILSDKAGKLYSIIVLDNATGIDGAEIKAFNYDALRMSFEKPLALRKIDYKEYPVFGFVFAETKIENIAELEKILKSDLREFVIL